MAFKHRCVGWRCRLSDSLALPLSFPHGGDKAHWIRITLCTLGNAARETRTHGNVFVLHELDRCDVDTGAKGLDLILNYYVNELSLFVSVPIYSILGMIVFGWLAGKWGNRADEIEVELTRQHYRQHSEDERAY